MSKWNLREVGYLAQFLLLIAGFSLMTYLRESAFLNSVLGINQFSPFYINMNFILGSILIIISLVLYFILYRTPKKKTLKKKKK